MIWYIFVNELSMYINYLSDKIDEHSNNWSRKSAKYLNSFSQNMNEGISYYQEMFSSIGDTFEGMKKNAFITLTNASDSVRIMTKKIDKLIEENQ